MQRLITIGTATLMQILLKQVDSDIPESSSFAFCYNDIFSAVANLSEACEIFAIATLHHESK